MKMEKNSKTWNEQNKKNRTSKWFVCKSFFYWFTFKLLRHIYSLSLISTVNILPYIIIQWNDTTQYRKENCMLYSLSEEKLWT